MLIKYLYYEKYFLSFIFLFISCGKEDIDKTNDNNDFTVSKSEIENLLEKKQNSSSKKNKSSSKQIEKIVTLNDDATKEPLIYVVNFQEKGFLIMAADKRVEPILAYSFDSKFDLDQEIDQGLASWFESKISYIKYVKRNIKEPLPEITKQWAGAARIPERFDNPDNNCDFITQSNYNYGPLLQSRWNQGSGFNNLITEVPIQGVFACQTVQLPLNGRYWAGCVPVAIAQIVRYHSVSSVFNWSNMPMTSGGQETSRLIKYIHDNIPITYSCSGTSVSTSVDIANFFKNKFNYRNAQNSNWNDTQVRLNLEKNKPVYVSAGTTKKVLFGTIKVRNSGHAWVCDGARSTMACYEDEFGNYYGIGYSSFHMNWGWGGSNNGYYSLGHFNTTNGNFNFGPKITYNITP